MLDEVGSHHGLSNIFDVRRTHDRRAVDTLREHLPSLSPEVIADHLAQLDSFAEDEQSDVTVYSGVLELLESIPSYQ